MCMTAARAPASLPMHSTSATCTGRGPRCGSAVRAASATSSQRACSAPGREIRASDAKPSTCASVAEGTRAASDEGSGFLDELGLEFHRPDTVNLAVNVVIALDQPDVLHFGTDLDDQRRALHLQ